MENRNTVWNYGTEMERYSFNVNFFLYGNLNDMFRV